MIIILLILFFWLIPKGMKEVFRLCRRSIPSKHTPADPAIVKRLSELDSLQTARDTQKELINYLSELLYDESSEKETIRLLRQKAAAEKTLAMIEKQIYKLL